MTRTSLRNCLATLICLSVLFCRQAYGQCPGPIVINSAPGQCGAVVNYSLPALYDTVSFNYTGAAQTWVVPAGINSITAVVYGAKGANSWGPGGNGGLMKAILPVTPGQTLKIFVGGQGNGITGGYNGGGNGALGWGDPQYWEYQGTGGGGASDIRTGNATLNDRIIVAGGGGGSMVDVGAPLCAYGGDGGGLNGSTGGRCGYGASGGSQTAAGSYGSFGQGGAAVAQSGSGGGGGGWYGGGGGDDYNYFGPGGGGSGYIITSGTLLTAENGVHNGNGLVYILLPVTVAQISGLTSGSLFPAGTTTNSFRFTHRAGNTSTCSFTVTVQDKEAPVAPTLPAITAECSVTVVRTNGTDNCAGAIVPVTSDPLTYTAQGTYTIHWTYNDGNGNSTNTTQTVIVKDVTQPVPKASVLPDITGGCSVTVIAPTAIDNCAGTITATTTDPLTYTAQGTYSITWTYSDGNGNSNTQVQKVVIQDIAKPLITAPAALTVSTDAGKCSAGTIALGTPVSSDNCSTVSISNNAPGIFPKGITIVTWTARDAAGNTAAATQMVTVADVETPVLACSTVPLQAYNSSGTYTVAPLVSSDNCGIANLSYVITGATTRSGAGSNASGTFNVGQSTITWTAADVSGNIAHCNTMVTVQAPTITISHLDGDNRQLTNNNIRPYLQLNNEGPIPVAYSSLTVRYWLTVEDFAPMTNLVIDWAQLGTNKVMMKYVKLPQPQAGAFGYIEYSFAASAGNLAAMSNSGPIQSRAGKSDWTNFNEADDYSYAFANSYTKNSKITVYQNGSLVWGIEPAAVTPVQSLKAYSQDKSSGTTTNTLSPWMKVNNEGNTPVSYKDITVRYWFTADGSQPLNYVLNYAPLGSSNVTSKFVKLATPLTGADTYLELGFNAADSLYPISTTGNLQHQISKNDWSNFSQLNDHSYKPGSTMSENVKVTVYVKGVLVYGTEPVPITAFAKTSTAISTQQAIAGIITKGEEAKELSVTVLNNPVTGSEVALVIRGAQDDHLQVTLLDAEGKIISAKEMKQAGTTERISLSVSNSAAGTYFVRVSTSKERKTVKVMRMK